MDWKKFVVLNLFFAELLYWHLLPGSPQYFHWQFWLSTLAASFHKGIACRWCMFCSFLWVTLDHFRRMDLCLHGQHMHTNSHICTLISICSDIYMYIDICRDRAQFSEKNCLFLMKTKFVPYKLASEIHCAFVYKYIFNEMNCFSLMKSKFENIFWPL